MCQAVVAMTGAEVAYCKEPGEPYCPEHSERDTERTVAEAKAKEKP